MSLANRVAATYERGLHSALGPGYGMALRRDGVDYTVRGWVMSLKEADIDDTVPQFARKAIILASSVTSSGFPTPIRPRADELVWQGRVLTIETLDEGSRRVQGVLVAYEMEVFGRLG